MAAHSSDTNLHIAGQCLKSLERECGSSSRYRTTLQQLLQIIKNIEQHSATGTDARRLHKSCISFQQGVYRWRAARDFLQAIGWIELRESLILPNHTDISPAIALLTAAVNISRHDHGHENSACGHRSSCGGSYSFDKDWSAHRGTYHCPQHDVAPSPFMEHSLAPAHQCWDRQRQQRSCSQSMNHGLDPYSISHGRDPYSQVTSQRSHHASLQNLTHGSNAQPMTSDPYRSRAQSMTSRRDVTSRQNVMDYGSCSRQTGGG
jgi:hypothetical protein